MRWLTPILRGIALRCPACGRGRLFTSYNEMARRCGACHVAFDASPGEWTGALMFAQGLFGLLGLGGWYLLVLAGMGVDDKRGIAWLVGVGLLLPILLYPSFKGAWFGAMQALGGLDRPGELTRP